VRYALILMCAVALAHTPHLTAHNEIEGPRSRTTDGGVAADHASQTYTPPPPLKPGVPLRVGGDVPAPRQTKYVDPTYPKSARGRSGTVYVEFLIGTNGRVREAHLLRSSPVFDKAAMAAVKQWRFEPTRFRGAAVSILMTANVSFRDGKGTATLIVP
jgi:TonB family protein